MKKLNKAKLRNLKKGQVIKVPFNQKILDAIVIDPNGLAEAQPSSLNGISDDIKT